MHTSRIRRGVGGLSLMIFPAILWAQASAGPPLSARAQAAAALNAKGQYAEALKVVEEGMKANPKDAGIQLAKIDALLGLRRYREAAPLAVALGAAVPEAKYKAGLCAMGMGVPGSAVTMWSGLYADPVWGGRAYEGSVGALLAQGRESQAKALAERAVAELKPPSAALLSEALRLGVEGPLLEGALESAAKEDPAGAELLKLWKAASGRLYVEAASGAQPLVLAVKEKSEEVQTTSLQWGGGTYAPQASAPAGTTAVSSSTQGYGAGMSSGAGSEGGKTGTLSSLKRVVLQVSLNGAKAEPMVLSSREDAVFLTASRAKKLGLPPVARSTYVGPGAPSPVPCDVVLLQEVNVGGAIFKNVPAKVIDPKTDYWKETSGILPLWLLRHHAMLYDRRGGKLTLYPSGTAPEPLMGEGLFKLKSQWEGGAPYVAASLQGRDGTFLLMDLDLPSTYLDEGALPLLGLTVNATRYGRRQEVGLFGVYSYGVAEHAALGLGPATIDLAGVRASDVETGLAAWSFGALGRETLDLFQIFVDYPANVIALKGYGK